MQIKLKELRKKENLSLNKLKQILKDEYDISVSDSQLMYYENEIRKPRDERIWSALADYFGVSEGYLLGYNDELMTFKSGAEFEEAWKKAIDRIETKERVERKLGKSVNKAKLDTKTLAKLENIKQRINQKYGTNTHGVPAYDALLAGVEKNNYFIHWFDMLLDLDKMNGTDISDLLYKYFVLDRDSKRLILELIDKLPQNKIENNKD